MLRPVVERLLFGVVQQDSYFRKGWCSHAAGIFPLKFIGALRQISYDISSDLAYDLFDVYETNSSESLDHFCSAVQLCFGRNYLRDPTEDDFIRIENSSLGCIFQSLKAFWTV